VTGPRHLPQPDAAPGDADDADDAIAARLLAALEAGRYDPPWVRALARDFGLAEDRVRSVLRALAAAGSISEVVPDLFYHPVPIAELARIVAELPVAQAGAFRDATGLGRKRAIQILEFFDRAGYTRREGNTRVILQPGRWQG
jgi:selenocysteine-specific elongation factor